MKRKIVKMISQLENLRIKIDHSFDGKFLNNKN